MYQAYYQLGLAYQKLGDKQAAKEHFQQATQIANYLPAEKALSDSDSQ